MSLDGNLQGKVFLIRKLVVMKEVVVGTYVIFAMTAKYVFGQLTCWVICVPYGPNSELCKPLLTWFLTYFRGKEQMGGDFAYSCGIVFAAVNIRLSLGALLVRGTEGVQR